MQPELLEQFNTLVIANPDLYEGLNAYRDWFNKAVQNYELILDDEWYEDKTTIEYQLRCLETFNILPIAVDEYANNKDHKGVWHLGDYRNTQWLVNNPIECMTQFISENRPVCLN